MRISLNQKYNGEMSSIIVLLILKICSINFILKIVERVRYSLIISVTKNIKIKSNKILESHYHIIIKSSTIIQLFEKNIKCARKNKRNKLFYAFY